MTRAVPFTITSQLPADLGAIPISAHIDFAPLLRGQRLDPTSIRVIDLADGASIPCHAAQEFAHGDAGRVEFLIRDPKRIRYEIHFDAVTDGQARPHMAPQDPLPPVGVGDLLRHNASEPRPVTMFCFRLVDLTGDGRADLAGTWNYYHRPGEPRSGVVAYPRIVHSDSPLCVGDQVRLGDHVGTYVLADFGDLTGDGRPDMVFAEWNTGVVEVHDNTGERDAGGWPIWRRKRDITVAEEPIESLSLVDLTGDGQLQLVCNGRWIRDDADPVDLGCGDAVEFLDLTGEGQLDAVSWSQRDSVVRHFPDEEDAWPGADVTWRRRLPGHEPAFDDPRPIVGLPPSTHRVAAVRAGDHPGLLVQHGIWQEITLFEVSLSSDGEAQATKVARIEAANPPLTFSDQSWPCPVDWEGRGVSDLVIGGGYGWPRVVRNSGSDAVPSYEPPNLILSMGRPIRLQRDQILPGTRHWHNMGYPYPSVVDWDGDGRLDLMLPNETNRIFWYKNIGTRQAPTFGPRQQLIVDGYPDDTDKRRAVGERALDKDLPNHPYPFDDTSPFFWRTGACFADFTDDGLVDLVTHDEHRKLTLFSQYIDDDGNRRLKKDRRLKLTDGREIDDSIVGRDKHWTESFRAVDWNGDGRLDIIYNTAGSGHIYLLANVGTPTDPVFAEPRQFKLYGEEFTPFTVHGPNCWPADLNDDDKPDLIGCVEWSVYPVFAHAALEMERHPSWELGEPRTL